LLIAVGVGHIGKSKYHELKYPSESCEKWEGVGSCTLCTASIGPTIPLDALETGYRWFDLRATCHQCPAGSALLLGPPKANQTFTSPWGDEFLWDSHCAEVLQETGKQVLMIRHGQSTWNKVMESWFNIPGILGMFIYQDPALSKLGLMQAQRLANILKKTEAKVYGSDPDADGAGNPILSSAMSELDKMNLEGEVEITNKLEGNKVLTDEEMVENLAKYENRAELDVLVGRKCSETNFVTSPLARAVDTLLIGTMGRFKSCSSPWQISSHLTEIEHNLDCEPKLKPGDAPIFGKEQHKEYTKAGIESTKEHVAVLYKKGDASRHGPTKNYIGRVRLWDQSPQMVAELDQTFSSPKRYSVWAGHSIWFRAFFQYFVDKGDEECSALTDMKMANTAIVSVQLRRLKDSPRKYVAIGCKFIHLGSANVFKVKG
jgi:hypothetical protein